MSVDNDNHNPVFPSSFDKYGLGYPFLREIYPIAHEFIGWEIFKRLSRGQFSDEIELDRIEQQLVYDFIGAIQGRFNVDMSEAVHIYDRALDDANTAVRYILAKALPQGFDKFYGVKNEVAHTLNDPFDNVMHMVGFGDPHDPRQQYEHYRQHLLALICAQIAYESRQEDTGAALHDFNHLLNRHVFEYNSSQQAPMLVHAYHSNDTNGCLDLASSPFETSEIHTKYHPFLPRYIPGIGRVVTDPREKSMASATLKSIHKAKALNSSIDPTHHIQDLAGVIFIALDGDSADERIRNRDLLEEKISEVLLQSGYQIKDKNGMTKGRNEQKSIPWRRVEIKDPRTMNRPIEVAYFSLEQYLNYRYYVGDLSNKSESHGHSIYEIMRAQEVWPTLFPAHIYPEAVHGIYDLEGLMRQNLEQEADRLRLLQRVR